MPATAQLILKWVLLVSMKVHAGFLTTDYLQQVYLVTADNSLVKLDSTGNVLFTYNQNRYGPLRMVDVSNPLKLLLSYPDFGTVVFLDNTLSEVGTVSMKQIGIYNYSTICFSPRDNNFWVYDENDFRLKKIDRNNNIVLQSNDLLLQLGFALHPAYMQEEDQYLYISDTSKGILIFDLYGVYAETLPFRNISKFEVRGDQIFFPDDIHLHSFQRKTLAERNIPLPEISYLDLRMENHRLYLLESDSLKIFQF